MSSVIWSLRLMVFSGNDEGKIKKARLSVLQRACAEPPGLGS